MAFEKGNVPFGALLRNNYMITRQNNVPPKQTMIDLSIWSVYLHMAVNVYNMQEVY